MFQKKNTTEEFLIKNSSKLKLNVVTGTFDLLHLGHMQILEKAKNLDNGSKLLVIVLSDTQVKRRKGDSRPIQNELDRIKSLEYLSSVDFTLLWNKPWEDISEFLEKIQINYIIFGESDPGIENKIKFAKNLNIKYQIFQKDNKFSTTALIQKILTASQNENL